MRSSRSILNPRFEGWSSEASLAALKDEGAKQAFQFAQSMYYYIDWRHSSQAKFDTVNDYLRNGEVLLA